VTAVKEIEFTLAEGRGEVVRLNCGRKFQSWDTLNSHVRSLAGAEGQLRSYLKCDLFVTWQDGRRMEHRYDMYHPDSERFRSPSQDVRSEIEFRAGNRPEHINETQYRFLLEEFGGEPARKRAESLLHDYDLG
jgi:hypothetical protein